MIEDLSKYISYDMGIRFIVIALCIYALITTIKNIFSSEKMPVSLAKLRDSVWFKIILSTLNIILGGFLGYFLLDFGSHIYDSCVGIIAGFFNLYIYNIVRTIADKKAA